MKKHILRVIVIVLITPILMVIGLFEKPYRFVKYSKDVGQGRDPERYWF